MSVRWNANVNGVKSLLLKHLAVVSVGVAFEPFRCRFRSPFVHIAKSHQLHAFNSAQVVHVQVGDTTAPDKAYAHGTHLKPPPTNLCTARVFEPHNFYTAQPNLLSEVMTNGAPSETRRGN
jgi:hypothetical protein